MWCRFDSIRKGAPIIKFDDVNPFKPVQSNHDNEKTHCYSYMKHSTEECS